MSLRLIALALFLMPATALAQQPPRAKLVCPDGMVLTGKLLQPKKSQRCCWPGQDYSAAHDQCVGVPECPENTELKGGTCQRRVIDPAKAADIRKFLVLTGSVRAGMQSLDQMLQSYQSIMPQVPPEFWRAYRDGFDESALIDIMVPVYDKHLSHDDLKALLVFYESEPGQRYLRALPDIQRDARATGQRFGQALAQRLEQKLRDAGYMSESSLE